MKTPLVLTAPAPDDSRPRRYGAGKPRFRADKSAQLDPICGCPEAVVPEDHLARRVRLFVNRLDTRELEREHSSLGRRAVHPKAKLAVWLYASVLGVHHASKVERLIKTDAAFRLLTGGNNISATGLRTFRRENGDFFADALRQLIVMAVEVGLVDPEDLSTDAMRLQAHASKNSIRTKKRSKARMAELNAADVTTMDEAERARHDEKLRKHEAALERCKAEDRSSYSTTNELAGLMKFPNGAALPGHRVTVTACGMRLRLVLSVLVGSEAVDHGLLGPSLCAVRDALKGTALEGVKLQSAADAGYNGPEDLRFALEHGDEFDILVHLPPAARRGKSKRAGGFFSRDEFDVTEDGEATCPAGRAMKPDKTQGRGKVAWKGVGCGDCELKARCTDAKVRRIVFDKETERLRGAMRDRMAKAGATERYRRRIGTVEPVFSYIEHCMGYRRASSRLARTVRAELLLKILAHNMMRLFFCASIRVLQVAAVWTGTHFRTLAIWTHDEVLAP